MLNAISPIDGRYSNKTVILSQYFSEFSLIRYRVEFEIEYFISLYELLLKNDNHINDELLSELRKIYENFSNEDAKQVKKIERITNHDVKAVEYFIKEKLKEFSLQNFTEFIHFGLTSQDINNTVFPLMTKNALHEVYLPIINELLSKLSALSDKWADVSMLAFTHGQPASPTRLGKEIKVFVYRLQEQMKLLLSIPHTAKFGGATGNFNAHFVAYPDIDWQKFAKSFLKEKFNLIRETYTTQISNYDNFSAICDALRRINTILIDLCRDLWLYIAKSYFKQKTLKGEIGSSAMPHKINPIDFENAEGNLGVANSLFNHLAEKLPVSRLQRDLTDSTVIRNIGVPFAHSIIAIKSILKGLEKLQINKEKINADLDNNWTVITEGIQTILRRENYPNPYEKLRELTLNNKKVTQQTIKKFIDGLNVSESVKDELKNITPFNYTGV